MLLWYKSSIFNSTILFLQNVFDPGKVFWYIGIDVGNIWVVTIISHVERHDTNSCPTTHQRATRVTLWSIRSSVCLIMILNRNHSQLVMTRKLTLQNPFFVYPPAQMTLAGRLAGTSFHSFLQTSWLMVRTSTSWRTLTALPRVFVKPQPATRHLALSFILLFGFGSWTGCTLFDLNLIFLESWKHTNMKNKNNHFRPSCVKKKKKKMQLIWIVWPVLRWQVKNWRTLIFL